MCSCTTFQKQRYGGCVDQLGSCRNKGDVKKVTHLLIYVVDTRSTTVWKSEASGFLAFLVSLFIRYTVICYQIVIQRESHQRQLVAMEDDLFVQKSY